MNELIDSFPQAPLLSDEAISRDSIYTREDDSNILLRVLQRHHPMHGEAWAAVRKLNSQEELVLAPQHIVG